MRSAGLTRVKTEVTNRLSVFEWNITFLFVSLFFLFVFSSSVLAASASTTQQEAEIPSSLTPWKGWVQHTQIFRKCPLIAGQDGSDRGGFLCAWPGVLEIQAEDKGMHFSHAWEIIEQTWIPLPGNEDYWPQQLTVNGDKYPVMDHEGPAILLQPGKYLIKGFIPWQERPQTITIPDSAGLVQLQMDDRNVLPLQREGNELTLGRSNAPSIKEADNAELRVYRKLSDGLPALLTTQIQLHISGKARELALGPVLPEGFTAVSLDSSNWRARLEGNQLYVQVQAGDATLRLVARSDLALNHASAKLPIGQSAEPNDSDKSSQSEPSPVWVEEEVWSYESAPNLRVTAVSGGIDPKAKGREQKPAEAFSVDPRQSGVPAEWQSLPAFVMRNDSALIIEERSRGLAENEGNRLGLSRTLWLDFDGKGFFARDTIRGQIKNGWRLDVAPPFFLERANDITPGQTQNNRITESALLITKGAKPEWSGVEWRNTRVELNAGARVMASLSGSLIGRLPINGWQQSFDEVSTNLRLPYGYMLLAAPGADNAYGSWIEKWNVMDVFFAAFVTLLAWRFLGVTGGVLAGLYFILGMHENDAPMWSLAALLMLALLVKSLPKGRLLSFIKWGQLIAGFVFLLVIIAFIPAQLRYALYPQLENSDVSLFSLPSGLILGASQRPYDRMESRDEEFLPAEQASTPAMAPPVADMLSSESEVQMSGKRLTLSKPSAPRQEIAQGMVSSQMMQKNLNRYSQSTVVQTGGGEPSWSHGHSYQLRWSGPVLASQEVSLIVSPPWLTRSLRVLLAVVLGVLSSIIFKRIWCGGKPSVSAPNQNQSDKQMPTLTEPVSQSGTVQTMLTAVALTLGLFSFSGESMAQTAQVFPPDSLLNELKARLNEPIACAPDCASVSLVEVNAGKKEVLVSMEVHATANVAIPLPSSEENLSVSKVIVDGKAGVAVLRFNNHDWIALDKGVHRVDLAYQLTFRSDATEEASTSLNFPVAPRRVLFFGQGWETEGIDEDRLINETLRITRVFDVTQTGGNKTQVNDNVVQLQQFPPFVQVIREFTLDLDWSVDTSVVRIAPARGGFTLPIPLVAGEHVLTPGAKVQANEILASLSTDEGATQWHSRLDKSESIELVAPPMTGRSEVWRIKASAFWHLDWNGVPVNLPQTAQGEDQLFEFHPLPGEKLTLKLTQPEAIKGKVKAIDQAKLRTEVGLRATRYILQFSLRVSQGGEHVIELPKPTGGEGEIEVLSVQRNREVLNVRPRGNKLTLPVSPGIQNFVIEMREVSEIGSWQKKPEFNLGLPAANIDLELGLPRQRWLLAAFGPEVGPAILYWGELLVAIVIALLLGRSKMTPLRFHHWLLLVLGFSTFSWMALAAVVFWIFAISWREKKDFSSYGAKRFDFMQMGFVLLTAIALGCLISVIPSSLMGSPDMHVVGYGSYSNNLRWFADHAESVLPSVSVLTVPIWVYRALMLIWSLWLAVALIGWLRHAFSAWTKGGYWRKFFNFSFKQDNRKT